MQGSHQVPEGERRHCGWGPVADDDGVVSGSCNTGNHDAGGYCTSPAERVFRLRGEDSIAYLCGPCSHVWREDGDWDYADPDQQFLAATQEELGQLGACPGS